MQSVPRNLAETPIEILIEICLYLPEKELLTLLLVSRRVRLAVSSPPVTQNVLAAAEELQLDVPAVLTDENTKQLFASLHGKVGGLLYVTRLLMAEEDPRRVGELRMIRTRLRWISQASVPSLAYGRFWFCDVHNQLHERDPMDLYSSASPIVTAEDGIEQTMALLASMEHRFQEINDDRTAIENRETDTQQRNLQEQFAEFDSLMLVDDREREAECCCSMQASLPWRVLNLALLIGVSMISMTVGVLSLLTFGVLSFIAESSAPSVALVGLLVASFLVAFSFSVALAVCTLFCACEIMCQWSLNTTLRNLRFGVRALEHEEPIEDLQTDIEMEEVEDPIEEERDVEDVRVAMEVGP